MILRLFPLFVMILCTLGADAQALWQTAVGSGGYDQGRSVVETPDHGYVVAGSTGAFGNGSSDLYLVKLDSLGQYVWSHSYGGSEIEWGLDLVLTPDSGFAVVGYTNHESAGGYDGYLLRTDANGIMLWDTIYGGTSWDFLNSIENAPGGGFLLSGETYSLGSGNNDGWVIRTDANGTVLWESVYGGIGGDAFHGSDTAPNQEWVLVGETESAGNGQKDSWLLRIDDTGGVVWDTTYGDAFDDVAYDVVANIKGFAVTGYSERDDGDPDYWTFMQTFDNDSLLWDNYEGIATPDIARGIAYCPIPPGRFFVTGQSDFGAPDDMFWFIYNTDGYWIAGGSIGSGGGVEEMYGVIHTADTGFLSVGTTDGFNVPYSAIYAVKTNRTGGSVGQIDLQYLGDPNNIDEHIESPGIKLFPNPLKEEAYLLLPEDAGTAWNVLVSDLSGRVLRDEQVQGPRTTFSRDDLPAGLYVIQARNLESNSSFSLKIAIVD